MTNVVDGINLVEPTADLSNICLTWWDSYLYNKWFALIYSIYIGTINNIGYAGKRRIISAKEGSLLYYFKFSPKVCTTLITPLVLVLLAILLTVFSNKY